MDRFKEKINLSLILLICKINCKNGKISVLKSASYIIMYIGHNIAISQFINTDQPTDTYTIVK